MSDPKLTLTADGSNLQFIGGQPVMDDGLENLALISLFTSNGWCGNTFLKVPVGSNFEKACNQPVTRKSLNEIRNAAELALSNQAFGRVTVTIDNPSGNRLNISARIDQTGKVINIVRDSQNWLVFDNSNVTSRLDVNFKMDESPLL